MTLNTAKRSEIRKFGLIAFLFFGCLGAIGIWREKAIITYFFCALSLLGMGLILFPVPLSPLYKGWLKIAHLIGKTVTTLILTLAYYLVITPSALIKRVFGGRPLAMAPSKTATSYWVARSEPGQPKERFSKRY
jgi:hypothetical protein